MTYLPADEAVHVRAPGKLNLFLRVGALRPDGYHHVATAYQAVSLYEDLLAWPDDEFSVSFSGSIDTSALPADDSNLAIRAAKLLAEEAGVTAGARLEIVKHVPIAGGMGGGSADAAAALLACDALWGTDLPRETLLRVAAKLGADVPFAFAGGTAVGTGRGDRLSPALGTGTFHWVLAFADFGLSTPEVYRKLDELREARSIGSPPPPGLLAVETEVLHALRAGDPLRLADAMANDLQAAAIALAPGLSKLIDLGEQSGALAGMVSGSGPTVAFLTEGPEAALALQIALSAAQVTAVHVEGPVNGTRIVSR